MERDLPSAADLFGRVPDPIPAAIDAIPPIQVEPYGHRYGAVAGAATRAGCQTYLHFLPAATIMLISGYSLYDEYTINGNPPSDHVRAVLLACGCATNSPVLRAMRAAYAEIVYTTCYSSTDYAHGVDVANWTATGTISYPRLLAWAQEQLAGLEPVNLSGHWTSRRAFTVATTFRFEHRLRRYKDTLVRLIDTRRQTTPSSPESSRFAPILELDQIWCTPHPALEERFLAVVGSFSGWSMFVGYAQYTVFPSRLLVRVEEKLPASKSSEKRAAATLPGYYFLRVYGAIYDDDPAELTIALTALGLTVQDVRCACRPYRPGPHSRFKLDLNVFIAADAANIVTAFNLWDESALADMLRQPRLRAAYLAANQYTLRTNIYERVDKLETVALMPPQLAPLLTGLHWGNIIPGPLVSYHQHVGRRLFTTLTHYCGQAPPPAQLTYFARQPNLVTRRAFVRNFLSTNLIRAHDPRVDLLLQTLPLITHGDIYTLLHLLYLVYERDYPAPFQGSEEDVATDERASLAPSEAVLPLLGNQAGANFRVNLVSTTGVVHRMLFRTANLARLLIIPSAESLCAPVDVKLVYASPSEKILYVPAGISTEVTVANPEPLYTVVNCTVADYEWLQEQLARYLRGGE